MALNEIQEAVRVGIVLVGLNLLMLLALFFILRWLGTRRA
jgi:hypothetical protein